MAFSNQTLPQKEVGDNNFSELDENRLCWRCGQPASEHSYFQGVTYCLPDRDEDTGDPVYNREIQLNPPEMDDAELIRRLTFVQDVRDWMRP